MDSQISKKRASLGTSKPKHLDFEVIEMDTCHITRNAKGFDIKGHIDYRSTQRCKSKTTEVFNITSLLILNSLITRTRVSRVKM